MLPRYQPKRLTASTWRLDELTGTVPGTSAALAEAGNQTEDP
jgi:hypothetical protein